MSQNNGSTQVLARKWRPRELSALVGQEHVVRALRHALQTQRLHHAYLFTGTRGVGKTTLARILAKALNCETGITDTPCGQCNACREIDQGRFVDLLEVDAATNTGVDEMRDLLDNATYAPTAGRYKVYVIDEVHMLSKSAFNAMLKTLEEPPPHMLFILATTDPQKIPVTVLSRCLQFNLKQMPPAHVVEHLQRVLTAEGIPFEMPALQLIGRAAQGSMRDALSLTDQAIAHGAGQLALQSVQDMLGSVDQRHLIDILDALALQDGAALLRVADDMSARSLPLGQALQSLAGLLYRLSVAHLVPGAIAEDDPDRDVLQTLAGRFTPAQLQLYYQIASHGRRELIYAPDEASGFGMCLLRMLAFLPQTAEAAIPVSPGTAAMGGRAAPAASSAGGSAQRPAVRQPAPGPEQSASAPPQEAPASAAPAARSRPLADPAVTPSSPSRPSAPARNPIDALGQLLQSRASDGGSGPQASAAVAPVAAAPVAVAPVAVAPVAAAVAPVAAALALMPASDPADSDRGVSDAAMPSHTTKAAPHLSLVPPVSTETAGSDPAAEPTSAPTELAPPPGEWPTQTAWPAFVQGLQANGLLRQMLDRSQLDAVSAAPEGDRLTLTVAVRAYLDPAHAERASQLLSTVMGRRVTVSVQLGQAVHTAQALADARQRERQAHAQAAIESDPFVRALQDDLGASVVPGSVRPL